ncbi:MAG TPA: hypothetical protein ENN55_05175 [Firmicutes bacterium]|nr:hypothetical protein [Bacillota bacterium]
MAESEKKQGGRLEIIQKTSILGTDREGNTTYKLSFYVDDKQIKSKNGMEVYAVEVLDKDGKLKRFEQYGDVPDGCVKELYTNGEVMMEKNYFNGQKNGPYKLYYPSGDLWKEGKFSNDQIIRLKTFSENGKLVSDKIFAEIVSIRTGENEVFYKQGREIARWVHSPDGTIKRYGETIDGLVKYYVGNTLKEEHTYDEGQIVSIKKYNKDGRVISERKFKSEDLPQN